MKNGKRSNSRFDLSVNSKNLLKSKRSQIKIQEMSFMLLALALFFVIALLFFLVISGSSLKKGAEVLSEQKAITTAAKLADTPELSCGEQLCVDTDKVLVLRKNPAFDNFWDVGGLVIKKLYPAQNKTIECNLGNYENCNTFTLKNPPANYREISSFVSLCKKDSKNGYSYDKCELGVISAYIAE